MAGLLEGVAPWLFVAKRRGGQQPKGMWVHDCIDKEGVEVLVVVGWPHQVAWALDLCSQRCGGDSGGGAANGVACSHARQGAMAEVDCCRPR